MNFTRRGMMKMITAAATTAVAGQFGISLAMAEDMKQELAKDLKRQVFGMPQHDFSDTKSIWFSVADISNVWATELQRQHPDLSYPRINDSCRRLARCIDMDLETAGVKADNKKVLVNIPNLTRKVNHGDFELRAGVVQQVSILGSTKTKVGFIGAGKLITGDKVNQARRELFGLS